MTFHHRQPRWRRSVLLAASGLCAVALAPALASAQQRARVPVPAVISADGDPDTRDFDVRAALRRSRFQLFGNQDLAFSGLNGVGNLWTAVSNVGPCENGLPPFCQQVRGQFQVFEYPLVAGVPRGDWLKNRDRAPSLRNAKGDGYSVMQNFLLFAGREEIGPADGTLGTLFAGATSSADGTCRDNSSGVNGFMDAGLPLLARSSCTDTWAGGVFGGDHPIPRESWQQLFAAEGTAFRFDFRRVPDNLKRLDRFLGTNFATYGRGSDHHSGILRSYGSVVPGGAGDPAIQGWPLGLDFEFQVYDFALPTVASAYFYQLLVINRSADVYGVGLDYDSLYVGIQQGTGHNPQADADYWEPRRGTLVHATNGVNTGCNGAIAPAGVAACYTASNRGFVEGASGIIFLKSPIGDLRNKLFSDPTSSFYMPGHPAAGDTFTINHGHMCGFGGCWATSHNVNDRRSFGMLSSTEENVIDGRTLGGMGFTEYWRTFRSRGYPTRDGKFNVYVPPGGWDYNKDGVADTLHLDNCGGPAGSAFVTAGCVRTWADTLPGHQNNRYGNVGGITAAGPFRLAAGDTAEFMMAFVGDLDSIRFESTVNNVIDFYQTFFFGPEPPPVADIVSTEVVSGGDRSEVTLFFTDPHERWTDPFLVSFANKIANAAAGTELARIRTLNPTLVGDILARASDNVAAVEIYKSCDGGNSFTSDEDCAGDPATDVNGNAIDAGWQAYAVFRKDEQPGGDLPNVFRDQAVLGGGTFLYVVLAHTRGGEFAVSDSIDTDGDGAFDALTGRTLKVAPALVNALSRSASDPNVVSVYVPFSRQAGSTRASLAFSARAGGATVPFVAQFTENVIAGRYRAVFGNFIRTVEVNDAAGNVVTATALVEDVVTADVGGVGARRSFDAVTGTTSSTRGVPFAGDPTSVTQVGDTITREWDGPLGFVVMKDATNEPLFLSINLIGTAATPTTVYSRTDFPGFVISADNRNAGTFAAEATLDERGDTIPQGNVNAFRAQWRQESATKTSFAGGDYHLTWTADPYGVGRGFQLNFTDPAATEAELAASLAARTATAAPTDTALASLLGLAPSDLRPARLPFTITNTTNGRPVTVVALQRARNTVLLGDGNDTIRVAVPASEWVPGDQLALIDDIEEDSLSGPNVVLGTDGRPIPVIRKHASFTKAVLGCNVPRESCNPTLTGTRGASGYIALVPNTVTTFHYFVGFNRASSYTFDVTAPVSGAGITAVSRSQLDSIRVVPNPFVVFSSFQSDIQESRVVFAHLPPRGTLRIYTISGQFVQQITWTTADLNGNGDLHYNLRTREGTDLASGLYIWVLITDVGGRQQARGKFVVIRGRAF